MRSQRRPKGARSGRPARPAGQGTLYLRVKPTGRVRVDGRWYPSPLTGLELPAGEHVVTVEHPEWGVSKRVRVHVLPGPEPTREVVELRRPAAGEGTP